MGLREIMVDGAWWVVFDALRGTDSGEETGGVLWAQSLSDKRRLGPAPPDWESWPDEALVTAIRQAGLPPLPLP